MKTHLNLLFLILFLPVTAFSVRIISQFEIARWYLDADLVIECSVQKTDTIFVSHFDSLKADGFRIQYDRVIEKYHIEIDSVLKSSTDAELPDTVFSQEFIINYSEFKIIERIFEGLDENGDSVFSFLSEIRGQQCNDDSYFRMEDGKYAVILSKTDSGYFIDYSTKSDDWILELLAAIEEKGESYFNIFSAENLPYFPFPTENAQWNVYLEYSISEAPVDTVLLRYFLGGDTTVNQINYKKLCLEKGSLAKPARELAGLIREQDKKIYYKGSDFLGFPHEDEWLLYDFDVQEGDTVWHSNSGYDYTVIGTIDSVEIDGQLRRRYKVDTWRNYYFEDEEYWIEGIGSIKNGLLGHITDIPTCCYHFWEFVCYRENEKEKYLNPSYDDCIPSFLLSSSGYKIPLHEITIHPNPVFGNFIVGNIPTAGDFGVSIYSSAGQLIKAQKLQPGSNAVQFPAFNGVAVVIITDSNGNIVKEEKLVSKRNIH
ncbi:Por secretion system C-terminal sorting domain-containing protein [Tangfeifania diversioriginum]|uniref:Por secretion system C-terminal sorting domain-containing protein n=1 Tax=Tangfeifania diversioriginum TaxID=1168035 RepID=A0A1M6PII4_9BACT|nr:hypothetical protein [Tangfeifania diversioriginum]SHK07746.1 Por secretion system C-terminal sorting domain-containing protein [Tangfeifania diversioriginum]